MRRRDFITLLGTAAAWPLAARAQQAERVRRIGVLMGYPENDLEGPAFFASFRQGLEKLGWVEDRNIRLDIRWAPPDDAEARQRFAKELVALQPDLILSSVTPTTAALLEQTRTIPIVFATTADPVGSGFVASLARPGGNVTGFQAMVARWLASGWSCSRRLRRALPEWRCCSTRQWRHTPSVLLEPLPTASFAVEAIAAPVRDTTELESVVAGQARAPNGGLIVMPDTFTDVHRAEIISLAARFGLPAVYPRRTFAELGGLLSYGIDQLDNYRRAASYADRILKGEKPGELPVQAPVKFELAINLKTAKALGLEVPPTLLARADEVIE